MTERSLAVTIVACVAISVVAGLLRLPQVDEQLRAMTPEPVDPGGFVTSGTCEQCHPEQYVTWHDSYHRTMTQMATPDAVRGDFDEVVLEDRGFRYRLYRRDDEFWVNVPDPYWFDARYKLLRFGERPAQDLPEVPPRIDARVVMTTGSHHLQNYWIRRANESGLVMGPDDGALVQLSWVWMVEEKRWTPNQDSFLSPPTDFVGGPSRWNAECSQCHSVGTQPRASATNDSFDTRTVELGIACEGCHGPAEDHIRTYRSPVRRYLRHFDRWRGRDNPDPTIVNPERLASARAAEACGYCHSYGEWRDGASLLVHGVPFQPGEELEHYRSVFRYAENVDDPLLREVLRADSLALEGAFWRDGTIRVAGREFNGLLESACFTEGDLTCTSCHSMHGYEDPADQLKPQEERNGSCLSCHQDLASAEAEHTRHIPGSAGGDCMNCHMPHTTYGLFSAMRSHRIDSPNVRASVEYGRPNACNLCHLDKTLAWTSGYLQDWYGHEPVELDGDQTEIAASILWTMKGDAVQRTLLGWHMGWQPAQEASGRSWLAPYLSQLLVDSYSATRQVAYQSIRTLPGFDGFRYDYVSARSEQEEKSIEVLERWLLLGGSAQTGRHLLISESAQIDVDTWRRLFAMRDTTRLAIIE